MSFGLFLSSQEILCVGPYIKITQTLNFDFTRVVGH